VKNKQSQCSVFSGQWAVSGGRKSDKMSDTRWKTPEAGQDARRTLRARALRYFGGAAAPPYRGKSGKRKAESGK
jgi:hypothetical protein